MKIRAFPAPSGSAVWRLIDPFKYLRKNGIDAHVVSEGGITNEWCEGADVIVLQNLVDPTMLGRALYYRENKGLKIVADVDDWWEANSDNVYKKTHEVKNFGQISEDIATLADMITTTNEHLAGNLYQFNKNVVVLPNAMDMERWTRGATHRNTSNRIRIGWAGSLTHYDDLAMVASALKRILHEFPQTELVLVGDMRFRQLFVNVPRVEVMLGVPMEAWPHKLHGLRLDIGIAPLVDNEFNRCKSNIKWQEYTIAGVPGVYSPTVYRKGHFEYEKNGLVAETEYAWYLNLRNLIICPPLREEVVYNATGSLNRMYNLERNIVGWIEAYRSLFN